MSDAVKRGLSKIRSGERIAFGDPDVIAVVHRDGDETARLIRQEKCSICYGTGKVEETCEYCDGDGEIERACDCQEDPT